MQINLVERATELLEKATADLQPELLRASDARRLMAAFARAEKVAAFGVATVARKVDDDTVVAKTTGTSVNKAHAVVETGKVLSSAPDLAIAMGAGEISLDQATEIAAAEASRPGAAAHLVPVAQTRSFNVLKEEVRKVVLDAEQHKNLAARQHRVRAARSYSDQLGMININLRLEPHIGTPIVARAEAEAARLAKKANKDQRESFDRYLADAYAALLSGNAKGRTRRPELVVVVSHEVASRGWVNVRDGEVCKIPGVGPVAPEVAKEIAGDAFLTGVFYDGKDLRHLKRWTRSIPAEVAIALELGEPPDFDGVRCVDCGNRFRTQFDHVEPHVRRGPASTQNLKPRCWTCHRAKTERDRKAGRLTPAEP